MMGGGGPRAEGEREVVSGQTGFRGDGQGRLATRNSQLALDSRLAASHNQIALVLRLIRIRHPLDRFCSSIYYGNPSSH